MTPSIWSSTNRVAIIGAGIQSDGGTPPNTYVPPGSTAPEQIHYDNTAATYYPPYTLPTSSQVNIAAKMPLVNNKTFWVKDTLASSATHSPANAPGYVYSKIDLTLRLLPTNASSILVKIDPLPGDIALGHQVKFTARVPGLTQNTVGVFKWYVPKGTPSTYTESTNNGVSTYQGHFSDEGELEAYVEYSAQNTCLSTDTIRFQVSGGRKVNLRLAAFISPEVIQVPGLPFFTKGDNRTFDYISSTQDSRVYLDLIISPSSLSEQKHAGAQTSIFPPSEVIDNLGSSCNLWQHSLISGAIASCGPELSSNTVNVHFTNIANPNNTHIHSKTTFDWSARPGCDSQVPLSFAPFIDLCGFFELRQQVKDGFLKDTEFRIHVDHDRFPWHEIYLDGRRIYEYDPCLTNSGPLDAIGSCTDISFSLPLNNQRWKKL